MAVRTVSLPVLQDTLAARICTQQLFWHPALGEQRAAAVVQSAPIKGAHFERTLC